MGQKVNPISLRLGINRGWDSVWFAKKREFGKILIEDYKIRDYIKKNVVNSGVSQVIIERTSKKCIVSIYTSRPGFVIGKKGSDVDKIKKNLSNISRRKFIYGASCVCGSSLILPSCADVAMSDRKQIKIFSDDFLHSKKIEPVCSTNP